MVLDDLSDMFWRHVGFFMSNKSKLALLAIALMQRGRKEKKKVLDTLVKRTSLELDHSAASLQYLCLKLLPLPSLLVQLVQTHFHGRWYVAIVIHLAVLTRVSHDVMTGCFF